MIGAFLRRDCGGIPLYVLLLIALLLGAVIVALFRLAQMEVDAQIRWARGQSAEWTRQGHPITPQQVLDGVRP